MKTIIAALLLAASAGCAASTAPTSALVRFRLDAPFCSLTTKMPLQFSADGVILGTDSLASGQLSPLYIVTAGTHRLATKALNGWIVTGDTTLVLRADSTYTMAANIYCS